MRLTVIYDDRYISIDNLGINFANNWPFDEEDIHAIQWYDDHGQLEYRTNDPNKEITDISEIKKYIDHYEEEKERILEEQRKKEEEEKKRQEMWHLAMQELQQELNETKMNYDAALDNFEKTQKNLNMMSESYKETQMQLTIANQINEEIQKMQLEIAEVTEFADKQILNMVLPNVIDNIAEFSDGVDMSMFEDNTSLVKELEELQKLDAERDEFDISMLEDEFNIQLMDDDEEVSSDKQQNEEDSILSIEKLLDELEDANIPDNSEIDVNIDNSEKTNE